MLAGQPFVGAVDLGVSEAHARMPFIATCLVDFVQTPCAPSAPVTRVLALEPGVAQYIPIQSPTLPEGLRDLVVVLWQGLGAGPYRPDDLLRLAPYQFALRTSLAVNGSTAVRPVEGVPLPWPYHVFGLDGVALSPEKYPWDSYGGLRPFTYLPVRAGEPFSLYLHVFNPHTVRVEYAASAFMDDVQVPISYRGVDRLPLYVSAKAGAWYAVPISLRAPVEPGHHELVVLGEHFPSVRLDLQPTLYRQVEYLSFDLWSSSRIYLNVVDKP